VIQVGRGRICAQPYAREGARWAPGGSPEIRMGAADDTVRDETCTPARWTSAATASSTRATARLRLAPGAFSRAAR
jgi:hypothetical protein